jgi:hypothetical protein
MLKSSRSFPQSWMWRRLLRRSVGNAKIDGMTVRVGRDADAKTVTAVLRALKATA